MVTQAEWLARTRDLGQVPPVITDPILLELAVDVAKDMTKDFDIWFLRKTDSVIIPAGTREGWPTALSRPETVYRFDGSSVRVDLDRVRDETFNTDYPSVGATSGPPEDYRLFGPNIQLGPTPDADETIYVDGYYYDTNLDLWFTHADDLLTYAALAGSEAAGFNDERISIWAQTAQRKAAALINEGSRQGYLVTPRTMRGDWRVTGGNRGG